METMQDALAKRVSAQVEMNERMKGRTPEQQSVIKYFLADEGCFSKRMTDEAYEGLVRTKVTSTDFKQKALDKIGLDESQVNEIPPVSFEGYLFDEKKGFAKFGKDRKWRSSIYQITWLFFSDTQVYLYQYTFNLDEDGKKESTEEYFYKDITNFASSSELVERPVSEKVGGCGGKKTQLVLKNVETECFALVVPGDRFKCSMKKDDYTEGRIQAMKAKLREKKQ